MRDATDPKEAQRLAIIIYTNCYRQDGGPGSGNWGHESVLGVRGGSKPGGGKSHRQGSAEKGYTSSAKEQSKTKDAENSAASSASPKSAAYKARLAEEKTMLLSDDESQQALAMWKKGYLSKDAAIDAMYDGSISDRVEEYYALMEENGDTTSEKPTTKDNTCTRNQDVNSGKYASHDEALVGYVREKTSLTESECSETAQQAKTWTSNRCESADTKSLDKFVENDHTYNGTIYRGLHLGEGEDITYDTFMGNVQTGSVISVSQSGRNASWSSRETDATNFAHKSNEWEDSVVLKCVANRTSSPIAYLNSQGESEVISHSKAQWTVLSVEETTKNNGGRHAVITVVERGSYKNESNGDGGIPVDEKKINSEISEDSEFAPMLDRWEASSNDFVVEPPKKIMQSIKNN